MILITGGTGFVGTHLVKRLVHENIKTRCLIRETSNTEKLEKLGIELTYGDINYKNSLTKAVEGVDTVIHLVGIIYEKKGRTFEIIHKQGTENLVEACKKANVKRFIYISALGARENAVSRYHITKYEAEKIVINSGMEYVIFRPSIMIGEFGEFITMLSGIIKKAPIIPIIGAKSKVQPIYVENTVDCIIQSIKDSNTTNKIFEIAGPNQITYKEFYITLMDVLKIKKPIIEIPIWFVYPFVYLIEKIYTKLPITTQQLTMLKEDNICDISKMKAVFHFELKSLKEGLMEFL